jgi:N-methylhydantoinase A
VLCALGDATTAIRDERARTFVRKFSETSDTEVIGILRELATEAAQGLEKEQVQKQDMRITYHVDLRYRGQGLRLTIGASMSELESRGLAVIAERFDEEHKRLFTFALPLEHEMVTLRAAVQGKGINVEHRVIPSGTADPKGAQVGEQKVYMDSRSYTAPVYDRSKLQAGNRIEGPAIVIEMDSTSVILPAHRGEIDTLGNILIYPNR